MEGLKSYFSTVQEYHLYRPLEKIDSSFLIALTFGITDISHSKSKLPARD